MSWFSNLFVSKADQSGFDCSSYSPTTASPTTPSPDPKDIQKCVEEKLKELSDYVKKSEDFEKNLQDKYPLRK